jgi:hypothetical protein
MLIQSEWYRLSLVLKPYGIRLSTRMTACPIKYGEAKKLVPPPGEQYHLPSASDVDRWEEHIANDNDDVEVIDLLLETKVK